MLEWIQFIVGAALILAGPAIFALSVIGVHRFKHVLNRTHAAAMGDTLGLLRAGRADRVQRSRSFSRSSCC